MSWVRQCRSCQPPALGMPSRPRMMDVQVRGRVTDAVRSLDGGDARGRRAAARTEIDARVNLGASMVLLSVRCQSRTSCRLYRVVWTAGAKIDAPRARIRTAKKRCVRLGAQVPSASALTSMLAFQPVERLVATGRQRFNALEMP